MRITNTLSTPSITKQKNLKPLSKSDTQVDSVDITTGIEGIKKIHYQGTDDFLLNYPTPNIFDIPQTEKDKFINPTLYADEPRLLQVILNTILRTPLGKEMEGFINVLREKNRIVFEDTTIGMDAYGRFGIADSGTCNDVLISIAKDNTIDFLASTLVHEISHFIDYYHASKKPKNNYMHRLSTEAMAFANSYRFLLESGLTDSYTYFLLPDYSKNALISCYEHIYGGQRKTNCELHSILTDRGYSDLDDRVEVGCNQRNI